MPDYKKFWKWHTEVNSDEDTKLKKNIFFGMLDCLFFNNIQYYAMTQKNNQIYCHFLLWDKFVFNYKCAQKSRI